MKTFLLDYFKDEQSFIDLQIDFLKQDHIYEMNSDLLPPFERKLIKDDFSINVQSPSFLDSDPKHMIMDLNKRYFYKTHLPLVVERLSSDYLEDFYNYIREELLEDQKKRRKFLTEKKKYISSIFENINQFDFIGYSLLNELKAQIIEIEKAVHSPMLYNDKYLKADKLTFIGWKEQDFLIFFNYLRDEKVISPSVTDIDLGIFLERNFCIEKDEELTEFNDLNKKLNYLRTGNKKVEKSLLRLKRLLHKF